MNRKNSKKRTILLVRLTILIGIILIGVVSLFYLENMFDKKHNREIRQIGSIEIFLPKSHKEVDSTEPCKKLYSSSDVETICKLVYGEGRGLNKTEMSAIVWCVLNRVDSKIFPNTIYEVCSQKGQFHGYKEHFPVWDNIKELVEDVLMRWQNEKCGATNIGRTLPQTYLFFVGDGKHNHYMEKWKSGIYYDWSLKSPYN